MTRKILVSVTTIKDPHWKHRLKEIEELGVKEFALFLTDLDGEERKECYDILEKMGRIKIPFVHARTDMIPAEYRYLEERFGTQYFNLHSLHEYPLKYDYAELKDDILMENVWVGLFKSEVEQFDGICLDLSHLENDRLMRPEMYEKTTAVIEKYPVIANHISAIMKEVEDYGKDGKRYDNHHLSELSELDYVAKMPEKYLGQYLALELTNDIATQLEAKKYLEKILN